MSLRLVGLKVSGFRGFGTSASFDLDADAVVIVGANGQGKTSLFDAVLWAIAGQVERLGTKDSGLMSLYSTDGQMRVELTLRADDGTQRRVVREFDKSSTESNLLWDDGGGEPKKGRAAESELLAQLWPPALEAKDARQSIGTAFTRANYLQQDLLCQFIGSDSDDSRFAVLAELLGAGRLRDLTLSLEQAQRSYTTTTTEASETVAQMKAREQQLAVEVAELAVGVNMELLETTWTTWWSDFELAGGTSEIATDFRASTAPFRVDAAARELTTRRDAAERRRTELAELLDRYASLLVETESSSTQTGADARLATDRDSAQDEVQRLEQNLAESQQQAERRRTEALAQSESRKELRALAELALRHLDGPCPVCEQPHDTESTRRHLESLIEAGSDLPESPIVQRNEVLEVQTSLEQARGRLAALDDAAVATQRQQTARQRVLDEIHASAERFDLPSTSTEAILVDLRGERDRTSEQLTLIEQLIEEVQPLSLQVARLAAQARRAELDRELLDLRERLAASQGNLRRREQARSLSGSILDALRKSTESFVDQRVEAVVPLLQAIYNSIDPHPTLQIVSLISRTFQGHGRLDAQVSDPDQPKVHSLSPPTILSSSQSNALALAIFLTLNLSTPGAPLASLLLDDPLQSLDRINLLGLVDVLRRTSPQRQLLVATHDNAFGQLLARKLRPAHQGNKTIVIRLDGWSRSGPSIERTSIEPDLRRLAG
jgi:DNA repair exonuclease SbcCD ATPase subunit